jgi:1,2-phenylacetyl-CoA epoxidase catalytic subunit
MAKKIKSIKALFNSNENYADILDLFDQDDIADEDIAQYANMDIDTVKSIKQEWINEETVNPLKKSRLKR